MGFVILVISSPPECLYIMNMHRVRAPRDTSHTYTYTYTLLPTTVRPSLSPSHRHPPPRLITAPQYQSVTAAAVLSRSTTERAINHFGAGRTRRNRRDLSIDGDDEAPGQARANDVSFIRNERTCPRPHGPCNEKKGWERRENTYGIVQKIRTPTRVRRI